MQSQEQSHQRPDSLPPDERAINVDPREQPQEQIRQQEDTDRSYEQGYSALDEPESWSRQGEKLRPRSRPLESKVWSLLLVALLCTVFIVAGLLGLILNWLSWLLVIAVLIAWLPRVTNNRHVTMRTLPPSTFQVMEHAQLNLRNHSGNVLLHRGEEGSINVAATIHARSLDYANMPVRYDQHGDSLTISSRFSWNSLFFGSSTVDFEITVPANCDVHLSNESGRVVLQGISGDIRVHADNASIETDNVQGQIILKTDHGSIQASNLQGQALLQTDHGSIEAHDLQGRITLKTDHGNIETSNLQGQIHLQTDHGNIAANG